jgi:hypothetical protein
MEEEDYTALCSVCGGLKVTAPEDEVGLNPTRQLLLWRDKNRGQRIFNIITHPKEQKRLEMYKAVQESIRRLNGPDMPWEVTIIWQRHLAAVCALGRWKEANLLLDFGVAGAEAKQWLGWWIQTEVSDMAPRNKEDAEEVWARIPGTALVAYREPGLKFEHSMRTWANMLEPMHGLHRKLRRFKERRVWPRFSADGKYTIVKEQEILEGLNSGLWEFEYEMPLK